MLPVPQERFQLVFGESLTALDCSVSDGFGGDVTLTTTIAFVRYLADGTLAP